MRDKENILGCFIKVGFDPNLSEQEFMELADSFRPYIWGENGLCNRWTGLKYVKYGEDLERALFQFHVKPTLTELLKSKEIEGYRRKERSIGIPIIINDENFFSKSETGRFEFLKQTLLHKLDVLAEVVRKKKLDTNIELLKADVERVLG